MRPYWEQNGMAIYHDDCLEVLPRLVEHADTIITDPPYDQGHLDLCKAAWAECFRVARRGASLLYLCGHAHLPRLVADTLAAGWTWWWLAGMRHTCYKRLPGKWVTVCFSPAAWFVKEMRGGDYAHNTPWDLVQGERPDKAHHAWGKPINWFEHWVRNLTAPGDIVLDPFMGAGTTGVACANAGRRFVGIDVEEACCAVARDRIQEALAARSRILLPDTLFDEEV